MCQICQNDSLKQLFNFLITILIFVCLLLIINYLSKKTLIYSFECQPVQNTFSIRFLSQKKPLWVRVLRLYCSIFKLSVIHKSYLLYFLIKSNNLFTFRRSIYIIRNIQRMLINKLRSQCAVFIDLIKFYLHVDIDDYICLFLLCQDFHLIIQNHIDGIVQFHLFNICFRCWKFSTIYDSTYSFQRYLECVLDSQNVSYDYTNTNHLRLVFLFLPIVIGLGIVLPYLLLQKLKSSLFLSKRIPFKDFGFWFTSYSNDHQHWEFYKFLLVNGLICIIIMIDANATIKGVLSYSLLIIYTKVCQDNKIYYHKQMNRFETQLNIISIIILISCTLFSIQENQGSILKTVILIFINSLFIFGGLFMFLHLWKLTSQYIKRVFCKVFELLGKFHQLFIKHNIFQSHSKSSIKLRKSDLNYQGLFKTAKQNIIINQKEYQSSEEKNQTLRF